MGDDMSEPKTTITLPFSPDDVREGRLRLPKIRGISRDAESPGEAGILIFPERRLTDDEMRWLHDYLNNADCRSVFDIRRRAGLN
jgi:hypothetical protein